MPGLIRGVARTAAIAGTATAVSGRVQRRQAEKYAGRDAQIAADRNAAYQQDVQQQAPPPPPPAPVAAAPAEETPADQITRLGELKAQGLLTDEEFAAAKAKVLGI